MRNDARLKLFLFLVAGFCTCLIVGDLIGGRLFSTQAFGIEFAISAGMIPFPVTFLITDLINEFYGKRMARTVTMVGFSMAVLTIAIIYIAGAIPTAPFTAITDASYDNAFKGSLRIFAASLTAFLFSQYTDIAVFHVLKKHTHNRMLWLRATGSTAVSQLIDTVAIQNLAWIGTEQEKMIPTFIYTSYAVKLLIAIGLTPLIYAGHALVERVFEIRPVVLGSDGEPVAESGG